MKDKFKPKKDPSLLRKVVEVYYERALQRKALRILSKQRWSLEFLEYLVKHAAFSNNEVEIEITDIEGRKIKISSSVKKSSYNESDILNRLDDPIAVQNFISKNGRR